MVSGGDILEISWSNPNGTGFFFPVAGEDSTYDLGGFRSDDTGAIDGAGRYINQLNQKPWMFSVTASNDMTADVPEFEAANNIASFAGDTTFAFTCVNGITYTGVGTVVGDIQLNGNKSTFTFKAQGGGGMKKI